jgi:hypothetical protein
MVVMLLAATPQASPSTGASDQSRSDTVKMTPADMLQRLDDFRASLTTADRIRLDEALPRDPDGGIAACDAAEGSRASCEAAAYMPALRTTGLMPRFLATIRSKP